MRRVVRTFAIGILLGGCAAGGGPAPEGLTVDELSVGTEARGGSCSTAVVRGLVEQLVAEANCLSPGAYERIDTIPGVTLSDGAAGAPYLHRDAAAALRRAVAGRSIQVNSALRTLPQQYLLRQWKVRGRCGIRAAARPGRSNHESGLAVDVRDNGSWQSRLTAESFRWAGSGDPPHFDFRGGEDLRETSVRAFQRLWNRNHPSDPIAVDGSYGPATEERLRRSPGEGFAQGARCDGAGDAGAPPPVDAGPGVGLVDAGGLPDAGPPSPPPPPPPTTSPCDSGHGAGCATCNGIANECGWCGSTGQCLQGGAGGPTSGTCPAGWEWVAPSQCGVGVPDPDPPPRACLPMASACAPGDCCAGLECRRGVSFGVRCCGSAGLACAGGGDCCGRMDCVSGICQCRAAGRGCLDHGDCCSGYCAGGTCG